MNVNEALLDKLLSHSCHAQHYQIIFFLLKIEFIRVHLFRSRCHRDDRYNNSTAAAALWRELN
jgi:hypothetical protein